MESLIHIFLGTLAISAVVCKHSGWVDLDRSTVLIKGDGAIFASSVRNFTVVSLDKRDLLPPHDFVPVGPACHAFRSVIEIGIEWVRGLVFFIGRPPCDCRALNQRELVSWRLING